MTRPDLTLKEVIAYGCGHDAGYRKGREQALREAAGVCEALIRKEIMPRGLDKQVVARMCHLAKRTHDAILALIEKEPK